MTAIGRTTNLQVTSSFISTVLAQQVALEDARQELSTGIKVSNPSDDPGNAGTISQFQRSLQALERYQQRIGLVTNVLNQQESTLNSAEQLLVRARELATEGSNETIGSEQRKLLAKEVFALRDEMVALANTKVQGQYIYGGGDSGNPPFIASTYAVPATAGDPAGTRYIFDDNAARDITRNVQISDSSSINITTPGDTVFANSISAIERLGRALDGYHTNPEDWSTLPDGTGNAYIFPADYTNQTAAILATLDPLETARNSDIVVERTQVGARLARIDEVKSINDQVRINIEQSRSTYQDSDTIEAASRFSNLQVGLQATLQSGAQINRLSLLDFL